MHYVDLYNCSVIYFCSHICEVLDRVTDVVRAGCTIISAIFFEGSLGITSNCCSRLGWGLILQEVSLRISFLSDEDRYPYHWRVHKFSAVEWKSIVSTSLWWGSKFGQCQYNRGRQAIRLDWSLFNWKMAPQNLSDRALHVCCEMWTLTTYKAHEFRYTFLSSFHQSGSSMRDREDMCHS